MPFDHKETIKYLEFHNLKALSVPHAIFTRHGGTSKAPWDTLNLGSTVGDEPRNVFENHQRALIPFGFRHGDVFDVWQVHGSDIAIADTARSTTQPHQKADIILTDQPGLPLFMRFADCVPILLFDDRRRVAGLVHAGWQGTVKKAAQKAVLVMQEHFKSDPADILAALGPSIGPDHYEIGEDVVHQVEMSFGIRAQELLLQVNGGVHFDLWQANVSLLGEVGVVNVENPEICTVCHSDDWFSHRGDHGKTGRFGALICIPG